MKAGLDEAIFWASTPYNAGLRINELNRAAGEAALATGWWAERLAREERLSSLGHYMNPPKPSDADAGDALIASWGMMHGLLVEDAQ